MMHKFSLDEFATVRPLTLSFLSWLVLYRPDILNEIDIIRIKEALQSSILPIPSKTIPVRKDKRNLSTITKTKDLSTLKVFTDYDYFKDSHKTYCFDFEIVQDQAHADFLFLVSNIRDFYSIGIIKDHRETNTTAVIDTINTSGDKLDYNESDTSTKNGHTNLIQRKQRIQRVNQFPYEGGFVRKDLLLLTVRQFCYRDSTISTTNSSGTTNGSATSAALVAPDWWLLCYDLSTEFHLFVEDYQRRMNESSLNQGNNNMWILKPAIGTRALGHIIVASSDTAGLMKVADTVAKLKFVYEEYNDDYECKDEYKDDCNNKSNGVDGSGDSYSSENENNDAIKCDNVDNSKSCTCSQDESPTTVTTATAASGNKNNNIIIGFQSASPPDRIAQLLIANPLLVLHRKFDLRVYVFVRSFVPFEAYMHECFYARLANQEYNITKVAEDNEVALTVSAYFDDESIANKQTRLNRRQLRYALEQEYERYNNSIKNRNKSKNNKKNDVDNKDGDSYVSNNNHAANKTNLSSSTASSSFPWDVLVQQVHTVCSELFRSSADSIGTWPASSSYYGLDIMFENNEELEEEDNDNCSCFVAGSNTANAASNGSKIATTISCIQVNDNSTTITSSSLSPALPPHPSPPSPPPFSAKLLEVNFCGDWSGIEDACNEQIDGVTGVLHYGHPQEPSFTYRDWVQDMMSCLATDIEIGTNHPRMYKL